MKILFKEKFATPQKFQFSKYSSYAILHIIAFWCVVHYGMNTCSSYWCYDFLSEHIFHFYCIGVLHGTVEKLIIHNDSVISIHSYSIIMYASGPYAGFLKGGF